MAFYNRVYCSTATTGTGSVTPGSAVSSQFLSFANANAGGAIPNGTVVRYELEEGSNFEIGVGTFTSGVLTRSAVNISCIGGAVGTTKMSLGSYGGGQTVRVVASAEDVFDVTAASNTVSGDFTVGGVLGANQTAYVLTSLYIGATGASSFGKLRVHGATNQNAAIDAGFNLLGIGIYGLTDNNSGTVPLEIRCSVTVNETGNILLGHHTDAANGAWLQVATGSTSKAQINFNTSGTPASPNTGDMWFDGTNLKFRKAGSTVTIV